MKNLVEFIREFAWPFGICGGVYAILVPFIPKGASIDGLVFLATLVVLVAVIITLVAYITRQVPRASHEHLTIEQALMDGQLLLVKKNDVLGINMGAHLYFRDGEYERMIGQGQVATIQSNGVTQLRVVYLDGVEEDLIHKIGQNVDAVRRNIIVRAGVIMQPIEAHPASEIET